MTTQSPDLDPADFEIDHIAVALPHLQTNAPFWRALGFDPASHTEIIVDQKVKVAMLNFKNNSRVELLEPTEDSSPVAQFLKKRGQGLHHLCIRVKNIDGALKKLKSSGVKLINETPIKGAHHCRVAFIHPSSTGGVLIELSEKEKGI